MFNSVLVLCFSGSEGGMELDVIRFCRRLSAYSQVTLIGLRDSPIERIAKTDSNKGFQYKFVGCSLIRFLARGLIDLRIILAVRSEIKKDAPDLIIFFGTSEIKSIALALYGFSNKLLMRIGTTINRSKNNLFQKIAYSRVDAFLATSEHIRRNILKSFPIASSRLVKICYPVVEFNDEIAYREGVSQSIKIIYHSRFVRGKGQLDAVKALHLLGSRGLDLALTLVGTFEDEVYVSEIKNYIQNYDLKGRIQILPNSKNIESLLSQSHIFICPSYGEGFSNSFAEALSFGLICIVYDNTALSYFKHLGFDFFLTPTGDLQALSEALDKAVQAYREKTIDVQLNSHLVRDLFSEKAEREILKEVYLSLTHSA